MSRIAIDARNINSSTGRYVERLIHFLEELDTTNQYIIIMLQKDVDIKFYMPKNPNFTVVGVPYPWFSFAEQLGMARFMYSLKADLVHFTMMHHPILYFKPYITTFHDLILLRTYNSDKNFFLFKAKQFVGYFVYLAMAHWSAHLVTPTKYGKQDLARFSKVPLAKISAIPEGCELTATRQRIYKPLVGKSFLLYVGQESDYKNIRRLMQAHQKLRSLHPELLLVLVGKLTGKNGPPLVANRGWAKQQGYEGIVYTDFLPDDQLHWVMKHCQVYAFPSLMEGFGLPALEAMALGAPVASSHATCLPEVYGQAAHYFDPKDINDMARAINDILTDPNLRQRLITRGYKQVKKYSWRKMSQQTLVLYKKILNQS